MVGLSLVWALLLVVAIPPVVPQSGPIRLRDKARFANEVVVVQGITGRKLDDISRSTRLYTLVDDFGDSIKVRTAQDWPPIGISFRVTGTIVYDGQLMSYVLVESERSSLSGRSLPRTSPGTQSSPVASPQRKQGAEDGQTDTMLLVGVGLIVLAGVSLMVVVSSTRRRRRAEQRRRQREEADRARAAMAPASSTSAPPVGPISAPPPAPPGGRDATISMSAGDVSPRAEPGVARGVTREAWGRLLIVDGPGVGTAYPLMGNKSVIGREPNVEVALTADDTVSRVHATLVRSNDGRVLFIDESRNGSRVNGQPVHMSQVGVSSGARIEVGMTALELTDFRTQAVPETPLSRRPTLQVSGVSAATGVPPAEIVVVAGPDASRRFPITKRLMTIGRLDDRDIQLTDPIVSRKHATLSFDGEAFVLQSESSGGAFIDDQRVDAGRLSGGERIKIGNTVLVVEMKGQSREG